EHFFLGTDGLESQVSRGQTGIDPREASTVRPEGLPASVRSGKFGPFGEKKDGEQTLTASLPEGVAPADLSSDDVDRLVQSKAGGGSLLGQDAGSGLPVLLMVGRFGPYVQLGETSDAEPKPRRTSLPKGVEADSLSLEDALKLLALPRVLGKHPETGEDILAGIGRYGPYVVHQKDFRSLGPSDDVHEVEL